jgi:hypothetical protein
MSGRLSCEGVIRIYPATHLEGGALLNVSILSKIQTRLICLYKLNLSIGPRCGTNLSLSGCAIRLPSSAPTKHLQATTMSLYHVVIHAVVQSEATLTSPTYFEVMTTEHL